MKKSLSALLLLISIFSTLLGALPQLGYAQTAPAAASIAQSDLRSQLAAIEQKTEARRKELGIPGISLVIVKDDRVIFIKGLGYKDFEKQIAVTPDTQFAIGSATKAFTALTALMAVDEGKLSLDDSPKKYLPYFKINNPDTDAKITLRDLMCHASGLNRTDLAMITGKLSRQELIQVAGEAKPVAGLREKFMYQNIMFTAAGEIVATAEKKPWEQIVPERIFGPLGMTNSTMSLKEMEKAKDYSYGYDYNFDTKETTRRPFRDIDQIAPAGSINSTARDMAQWLRFVLNGGTVNGKRLVSEKNYDEWLKPQMPIGGQISYGFGWFLQQWNGMKVVQHGGNIDGFNSMVAMIPEKKIGFVMLTNVSNSSLGAELMPIVFGGLLGDPNAVQFVSQAEMQREAGKYNFKEAGFDVDVKFEDGKLLAYVPGQPTYTLQNVGSRKYKLGGAPDGFYITFKNDSAYLEQPQGNFTLPKAAADSTTAIPAGPNPAKELIGRYEAAKEKVAVEIKEDGGKVFFVVPGQQPYELKERSKDLYNALPLPDDYQMRVTRAADGKVAGVEMVQPGITVQFKYAGIAETPKITSDELMTKAMDAIGGEANWRKVNSRVATFELDLVNQGVKGYGTSYAKAPNKSATETTMTALGKTIASGFEFFDGAGGEEGYTFAPVEKFTGKRLDDVKLDADFYGPLDWKMLYKKIEIARVEKVGDEDCYVVSITPVAGSGFTDYYSTKTFLLVRRDSVEVSSTSDIQLPVTTKFYDYRDVDGIKMPFRTVSSSITNGDIITTLKDVKQNVEVKDDVFKPRKL
jgi:CubicO group peptidase (beta-lactamase class C family)